MAIPLSLTPPFAAPTADEIRVADAIASLFGIEADDGFRRGATFYMRWFVAELIDTIRINWRTDTNELWRDVLKRIAKGPAEAAAMIAQRDTLSHWHRGIIEAFVYEIEFEPPTCSDHIAIVRAYEAVSERARSMLKEIGPSARGKKTDHVLFWFINMLIGAAYADHPDILTRPPAVAEAVATALALAVLRARGEIAMREDPDDMVKKAASDQLDAYARLGDDAIRIRVSNVLAELIPEPESQEAAPNAIRAGGRN